MLETLLGSKLRAKVLGWLFTHPDERFYVRQLNSLLGEDSTNVSRELARLEKAGILISTTEGRQKYYQADRRSPFFDELHRLIVKTVGVVDVLRSALLPAAKRIRVAFVFGSVATGAKNRTSDVDVMVVGKTTFGEIVSLLGPAQATLGREINPVVYPVSEFRQKQADSNFLRTVVGEDKVFFIGDEDELAGLGKTRKAASA
ncbi:MAG: helix-turn-helix domain-containing protein [Chloroflexi bacterium]|nr:helix-turn-helix domain-containing protein [Chloroflexota bacterium]